MHTVFRIGDIQPMDEHHRLFQVELTLTSDNDKDLRVLTDRIQEETFPDEEGWYRLGKILLTLGKPKKAQQVYEILLKQTTDESKTGSIYRLLGWAKDVQAEYQEAITFYEKSIKIYKKTLPPNHPDLAASYNNIGGVYDNMGDYSKALSSHEKALEIRQQSLPPNHPDLAASYNNIGAAYENMGNYSKASSFYKRAVDIGQQSLPSNHPDLKKWRNNLDRIKKKL
jgi:tetratricopeptide (TPR) repeat protein